MSSNPPSTPDTPKQSEQTRWEIVHALTPNDKIRLNHRNTTYTVQSINASADEGVIKELLLTGPGEPIKIRVVNSQQSIPIITYLDSPHHSEPVTYVEILGEHIHSSMRSHDFLNLEHPTDEQDTAPGNLFTLETDDIEPLENCPVCGCCVVSTGDVAICTGCDTWCWIEEWKAYVKHVGKQLIA